MYCNYSKDKFGNELTFIIPCWTNLGEGSYNDTSDLIHTDAVFINSICDAEDYYLGLLNEGWMPQQARAVLPNTLKTELVMTGFISDWKHFFELRCDKAAHPQARELAIPLQEEFIKRGYIYE